MKSSRTSWGGQLQNNSLNPCKIRKTDRISNVIFKDVKEFNIILLILIGLFLISISGYSSYAIFSDEIVSNNEIKGVIKGKESKPNPPLLSSNMIPVYYDESDNNWHKADSSNSDERYKWYDYDNKMWANVAITSTSEITESVSSNTSVTLTTPLTTTTEEVPLDMEHTILNADTTLYCMKTPQNGHLISNNEYGVDSNTCAEGTNVCSSLINNLENGTYPFYVRQDKTTIYELNSLKSSTDSSCTFNTTRYTLEEKSNQAKKYVSDEYDFDKNTKKYTLKNASLQNYTSSSVGKYTCDSETSTSCDTMYKIVTAEENKVTKADKYTSGKGYVSSNSNYKTAELGTAIPMEDISAMFVWIPRYKYKVWNYNLNGDVSAAAREIEVTFEKKTASTGDIICNDQISGTDGDVSEICKINDTNCTDEICNNYKTYTHPAFTFGDEELTGIWVGKFENGLAENEACFSTINTSNCNKDAIKPIIKPDVISWTRAKVAVYESAITSMNDNNNIYGFEENDDTHMIKNSEWGAVAYFSHSKYGKNDNVFINNSSKSYTGRSGGNVPGSTPSFEIYPEAENENSQSNTYGFYTYDGYLLNYKTNEKSTRRDLSKVASTTGNIYGIYDMSGGLEEYVASNMVSNDGITMLSGNTKSINSGYTGKIYDSGKNTDYTGTYNYLDDKYYDKYSYSTSNQLKSSKLGDAIKEVYYDHHSWYVADFGNVYLGSAWHTRGGASTAGDTTSIRGGIFYSIGRYGYQTAIASMKTAGSRTVISK